ncbi:hypothetical protein emb_1c0362 [Coriobacteriaceae bacterium EMTCatB1]|nr:hypothetical protein emb_1c0362 [Coriobacteriaceae bacterium EMTCatB1]
MRRVLRCARGRGWMRARQERARTRADFRCTADRRCAGRAPAVEHPEAGGHCVSLGCCRGVLQPRDEHRGAVRHRRARGPRGRVHRAQPAARPSPGDGPDGVLGALGGLAVSRDDLGYGAHERGVALALLESQHPPAVHRLGRHHLRGRVPALSEERRVARRAHQGAVAVRRRDPDATALRRCHARPLQGVRLLSIQAACRGAPRRDGGLVGSRNRGASARQRRCPVVARERACCGDRSRPRFQRADLPCARCASYVLDGGVCA